MAPLPDDDDGHTLPRRPLWPPLLVFALALCAGGYVAYRLFTAPSEQKVLVMVDLEGTWFGGSEGAAALADNLSDRLEKMGFLVVRGGDPDVTAVLEAEKDPAKAAARLRAAWVVAVDFEVTATPLPVEGGYTELRAIGPVRVLHADAPPAVSKPVSTWSGAKVRGEALRNMGENLADRVFDAALPLLVEHPALRDVFHAGASSPDGMLADKLRPARAYVEERATALAEAERKYKEIAQQREQGERGPVVVTFHSDPAAHDGLGGVGRAGALVKTEDAPLFFLPEKRTLGRLNALESLVLLDDSGTRTPLWSGYNLYSYPVLGPDGAGAVIVEDLFGWAKTITLVTGPGQARRLRVDPTHRFSTGRLAPGGKRLAISDDPCRECPSVLLIVDTESGATVHSMSGDGGNLGGWAWLDASHLAVLYTPAAAGGAEPDASAKAPRLFAGPGSALYSVDVSGPAPVALALWQAPAGERLSWLASTPDARRLAFEINRDGDDELGIYDVSTRAVIRLAPGRCSSPSLSPDGLAVTFQWHDRKGGDEEVAVIRLERANAELLRLTDNAQRDRYPQFDAKGTRIYFESVGDDPNFPRRRSISRIASVPYSPN